MLFLATVLTFFSLGILLNAEALQHHRDYERAELFEAYEAFGVNDHVVQNEFELFRYAGDLKKLMDKRLAGRDRRLWDDKYVITEVTPREINSEDMVYVSYKNSYPERGDWIAAYSPPVYTPEAIAATVPVKFGWCDEGGARIQREWRGHVVLQYDEFACRNQLSHILRWIPQDDSPEY